MEKIGQNLTIAIPVGHEKDRLPLLLRNLAAFQNVFIADDAGTTETKVIAAQFGRPVYLIKNKGGWFEFEEWMVAVWAKIKTDYLLMACCADFMPRELLKKYVEISDASSYDVVLAKRVSITDCLPIAIDLPPRWLNYKYKGELRFYKKGAVDYVDNPVHGIGKIVCAQDRVLILPQKPELMFYQYRDYDASESEGKHRVYNDVWAEQRVVSGGAYIKEFIKEVIKGVKSFIFCYFLYGGFRYGMRGFMLAYYRFHLHLTLAFRFYERSKGRLKADIQRRHLLLRDELLKKEGF